MKMAFKIYQCVFLILIISCSSRKEVSIEIDEFTIAEGDISRDTTYNGVIKLFDKKSKILKGQYHYKNGIRDGKSINYYVNGKIASISFFENGKLHGGEEYYDTNGEKMLMSSYYYNLKVGPEIDYLNGSVKRFRFYSLENKKLIDIAYDSIKNFEIVDKVSEYFFYYVRDFDMYDWENIKTNTRELFFYTPNPPNYNFTYNVVLIDSSYLVHKVIQPFTLSKLWSKVELPNQFDKSTKLALQLHLVDPKAGGITLYKRL